MADKPRIVILGGGVGAITAAFYLTRDDSWKDRFASVTVYQQGWRLGGKGASGRGEPGQRIEEHGLHIWFGFYENAFRMLHDCHEELDRRAEARWSTTRVCSVDDSFRRCSTVSLTDYSGCDWRIWSADFPEDDDDAPWLPRHDRWTVADYVARTLELAAAVAKSVFGQARSVQRGDDRTKPSAEITFVEAEIEAREALVAAPGSRALDAAAELMMAAASPVATALQPALELVLALIDRVLDAVRLRLDALVRKDDGVRRAWYLLDLLLANVRGVIVDGVIEADDFDVVDDWDYRAWLLRHGAMRESVDSAFVRAVVYDLAFAYEDGDTSRPRCGAGTALRGLARTFLGYRGALMYKMNAGMGDVVFAPLYEALVKRGVGFEFFHRVEKLHVENGLVTAVDLDVQAAVKRTAKPEDYVPAFEPEHPSDAATAAGTRTPSYRIWPSVPSSRLGVPDPSSSAAGTGSEAPSGAGAGPPDVAAYNLFESYWGTTEKVDDTKLTLPPDVLGSGRVGTETVNQFDIVVFGLSIGSVPFVADELVAANTRWSASVTKVKTVATQALQLWLTASPEELGPEWTADSIVGGFVEPFDTWADMLPLSEEEKVAGAKTVAYFCNVLPDPPPTVRGDLTWLEDQDALVKENAVRFITRDLPLIWPSLAGPPWDYLVDPEDRDGSARLEAQFWRANVEPSERYVLSVPGSSKYRIPPDDTGFANLYAVGDWTACKLNAGCVEAAVISGLVAANAINRAFDGPVVEIIGYDEP
jgi:uncharacterized protein with NAD-binding domain and iron-sulfur cluster